MAVAFGTRTLRLCEGPGRSRRPSAFWLTPKFRELPYFAKAQAWACAQARAGQPAPYPLDAVHVPTGPRGTGAGGVPRVAGLRPSDVWSGDQHSGLPAGGLVRPVGEGAGGPPATRSCRPLVTDRYARTTAPVRT